MTQSITNVSTLGTHTRGLVTADRPLLLSNLLPNSTFSVSCDTNTTALIEVSLSHASLDPVFIPDRLRAQFDDLSEPLDNAAQELTRRIWYRFAFKRDPDGQRWKPWARSTRLAAKPGQRLMLSTRALRDGTQFRATRKGLWLKFGTAYGIHHELGGRKTPRRSFAFSTQNNHRALAPADEQYLLNAVRYQLRKAALNRK